MLPDGPVRAHPVLASAFEMLEEGNFFLQRYNELTGSKVAARFPSGAPYLPGGESDRYILKQRPASRSDGFFEEGKLYLGGFDKIGFTRFVYKRSGLRHDRFIRGLLDADTRGVYRMDLKNLPPDKWREVLPVGALLAHREGPWYHVMIYIGTLQNYGFIEEELPAALRPCLQYPLFIRCDESPAAARRNEKVIEALARDWPIYNTNGGVHVCIAGVPAEAAAVVGQGTRHELRGFELAGQELMLFELGAGADFCGWYPQNAMEQNACAETRRAQPEI